MSKRQMEVLVDDIDGTPIIGEQDGRTIPVKIGSIDTTLDLTNENIARLESVFREFVSENPTPAPRAKASTEGLAEVRAWARKNGYQVNDRGRIPFSVMDAYTKAHLGR
jgi:hypothetical protein